MGDRGAERAGEAVPAVEGDLPGAALELLQDVRAGAGRERERPAVGARGERERLLDEEPPARRRRRRVADHRRRSGARRGRSGRRSRAGRRASRRSATGWPWPWCAKRGASRYGSWAGREAGRGSTCARCLPVAWPSTGSTVRTRVSGRCAGIVSIRCARRLGAVRTMWSCSSTTSGWLRGALAAAAEAGAARSASASPDDAPAEAGVPQDGEGAVVHPVNCEGPWRGRSTWAAQAR